MLASSFSAKPSVWDIFCTVIDNFGDIGVCWRLARQLVDEHGVYVRLWVDDLGAFRHLCATINPAQEQQEADGVDIRHWTADFQAIEPGNVVIEAFACRLPASFEAAMARRTPAPRWINLDYLSAEDWVSGCHALPSPHPRLPLTKYFFFPGFTEATGGLLRERDLAARRSSFCVSREQQVDFWQRIGQTPPADDAMLISLFAYENPALSQLLRIWSDGARPVCCLAPVTRTLPAIEAFAGRSLQAGDTVHSGQLEIRLLPFVPQSDYDRLLWLCDVNFVRGEDSFVRAQWAARPMLWHIYPQDDDAHLVKLAAFLDLYCADMSKEAASTLRQLILEWNRGEQISSYTWAAYANLLPDLQKHAVFWEKIRSKQEDLCSSLVRFCRSTL